MMVRLQQEGKRDGAARGAAVPRCSPAEAKARLLCSMRRLTSRSSRT